MGGIVGKLFGGGSSPQVTPAPPAPGAPDNEDAKARLDQAAREERVRRAGQGAAANVLTSPLGLGEADQSSLARKKLLGS